MTKISLDLPEDAHIRLLELQLERKRNKQEPSAINKIATELLVEVLIPKSKTNK